MPRENVHWEVLLRASACAEKMGATKVPQIIAEYKGGALLGAIAHDAPYYYRGGGKPFEGVAGGLHGLANQDTFVPFRKIAAALAREQSSEAQKVGWAFLLGMISHAVTDILFHPWIFFFSGDYYHTDPAERAAARARHRLLEVYLDAWQSLKVDSIFPRTSAISIVRSLRGEKLEYLAGLLGDTVTLSLFNADLKNAPRCANSRQEWKDSLWQIAIAQATFTSPLCGLLLRVSTQCFPGLAEIESLCGFRRKAFGAKLGGAYEYKNPVTGDPITASLDDLLAGAIKECGEIFLKLDSEICGSAPSIVLDDTPGKSLNYGVFGAAPDSAKIFSHEGLSLPGMKIS